MCAPTCSRYSSESSNIHYGNKIFQLTHGRILRITRQHSSFVRAVSSSSIPARGTISPDASPPPGRPVFLSKAVSYLSGASASAAHRRSAAPRGRRTPSRTPQASVPSPLRGRDPVWTTARTRCALLRTAPKASRRDTGSLPSRRSAYHERAPPPRRWSREAVGDGGVSGGP